MSEEATCEVWAKINDKGDPSLSLARYTLTQNKYEELAFSLSYRMDQ
jgi:hypothetical protein